MSILLDQAKSIEEFIIHFRRDLHENPELSGQELIKDFHIHALVYGNPLLISSFIR
ncbi:hypothetical protein [Dehalobacterium formicoaceticum]|uniref:hypothetical protein n=1 Tax=Dehalobacterium formicoaceticum TaxID=51515 RepID=UPI0012F883F7|nr:hypothetical protein [Dehalobacterium formicoaceticum]